jgi:hypothetical protein
MMTHELAASVVQLAVPLVDSNVPTGADSGNIFIAILVLRAIGHYFKREWGSCSATPRPGPCASYPQDPLAWVFEGVRGVWHAIATRSGGVLTHEVGVAQQRTPSPRTDRSQFVRPQADPAPTGSV